MSCMRAGLPVGADLSDQLAVGRFEPQQEAGETLGLECQRPDLGADGGVFGGGMESEALILPPR